MKYIFQVVLITVISSLLLGAGCKKTAKSVTAEDQIIFGISHGHCVGKCRSTYVLDNKTLYADTSNNRAYIFELKKLPDSFFQKAKFVMTDFPEYLLKNTNQTFGCPDCADQGTIVLTRIVKQDTLSWRLDTQTNTMPKELKSYADNLLNLIYSLNEEN